MLFRDLDRLVGPGIMKGGGSSDRENYTSVWIILNKDNKASCLLGIRTYHDIGLHYIIHSSHVLNNF